MKGVEWKCQLSHFPHKCCGPNKFLQRLSFICQSSICRILSLFFRFFKIYSLRIWQCKLFCRSPISTELLWLIQVAIWRACGFGVRASPDQVKCYIACFFLKDINEPHKLSRALSCVMETLVIIVFLNSRLLWCNSNLSLGINGNLTTVLHFHVIVYVAQWNIFTNSIN